MKRFTDLEKYKSIPILSIANKLGIKVIGKKAMCFSGHDKKTPSLSFLPEKNIWKCFGCNRKGDSIKLVMEVKNCDFVSAISWISQEFFLDSSSTLFASYYRNDKDQKANNGTKKITYAKNPEIYKWFLNHCGQVTEKQGVDYLNSHNISIELANKYQIKELKNSSIAYKQLIKVWGIEESFKCGLLSGSVKKSSLIWKNYTILFPFLTINNVIVYIQGRQFERQPKYLNLKGIEKPLFNVGVINKLRQGDSVYFCEGIPDAISLSSLGVATIGVLGASSFSDSLAEDFLYYKIYVVPDGDNGGEVFLKSLEEIFSRYGKPVYSFKMKKDNDVSGYLYGVKKHDK